MQPNEVLCPNGSGKNVRIPGNDAVRFRTPHYYLSAGVLQMKTIRLETALRDRVVNGTVAERIDANNSQ